MNELSNCYGDFQEVWDLKIRLYSLSFHIKVYISDAYGVIPHYKNDSTGETLSALLIFILLRGQTSSYADLVHSEWREREILSPPEMFIGIKDRLLSTVNISSTTCRIHLNLTHKPNFPILHHQKREDKLSAQTWVPANRFFSFYKILNRDPAVIDKQCDVFFLQVGKWLHAGKCANR